MDEEKKIIGKLEERLLNRELDILSNELGKIGKSVIDLFSKYGRFEGNCKNDLLSYLHSHVFSASTQYLAGYTTVPYTNAHKSHIPDSVKKVILAWAVDDFLAKVSDIEEVVSSIE